MATVDGITAERGQEIEDASVVSGAINGSNGHLILTTAGGTNIDAGLVVDTSGVVAHAADTSTHGVGEVVGRTEAQTLTNKTMTSPVLTTPTIASLTNAQHTHANAAGGGTLFSGVQAIRTATQIIADATQELIAYTATSAYDTHSYKTTNTMFTLPATGYYDIVTQTAWAGNSTGRRSVGIRLNDTSTNGTAGTSIGKSNPTPGHSATSSINVCASGLFQAGDTIKVLAFQNSGGNLNIMGNTDDCSTSITIHRRSLA